MLRAAVAPAPDRRVSAAAAGWFPAVRSRRKALSTLHQGMFFSRIISLACWDAPCHAGALPRRVSAFGTALGVYFALG